MGTPRRSREFWLAALRREGSAFRSAVTADDLTRPVPSCPAWTVANLIGHLGQTYRWHRAHLLRGATTPPDAEPAEIPAGPAILPWWEESFDALVTALTSTPADFPAWNWSMQPKTALFWHRRMAQETAIHRWDAQVSVGLPEPVETDLAVDGIDEVLDTHLPAGDRMGPTDQAGVVRLQPTDDDTSWTVRVRGEGLSILDTDTLLDDGPHAQAAASGSASDLLLALWGRVPLGVLTIEGNAGLVSALRTG